ncbi:ferritin family protein [Actinomyces weissii]|uniref:DUF4439 domain-containing protein n=1 Tax=Actinomyces weissii TaxID=675090 RepID=A0A7T7M8C5_9ACTO|nr:hypothetical protein [Actinomyces weissii]QQM66786.1 hypothetical protein JG540_06780 [Actinomyces weissii]
MRPSLPHPDTPHQPVAPGGGALPVETTGLRRRVLLAALGGTLTAGLAGCELRLGTSPMPVVPTADAAEAARDSLARQARLISETAEVVAQGGQEPVHKLAAQITHWAATQAKALGGVWEPWPTATALPSGFPTATPLPTASATAGPEELVSCLEAGADLARGCCEQESVPEVASTYASLYVAWTVWQHRLAPQTPAEPGRDTTLLSAPLPAALLLAYDSARFTLQTVAARSTDAQRERAVADAQVADRVVRASLALGGEDPRLPAYDPPQVRATGSPEQDWAHAVEMAVLHAEVAACATLEGADRLQALAGAADMALRARQWGSGPGDSPWPGLDG